MTQPTPDGEAWQAHLAHEPTLSDREAAKHVLHTMRKAREMAKAGDKGALELLERFGWSVDDATSDRERILECVAEKDCELHVKAGGAKRR